MPEYDVKPMKNNSYLPICFALIFLFIYISFRLHISFWIQYYAVYVASAYKSLLRF